MKRRFISGLILSLLFSGGCKKDKGQPEDVPESSPKNELHELVIPDHFNYKTEQGVKLTFDDHNSNNIYYEIYTTYDDFDRELIARGKSINGYFSTHVTLPGFCEKIQVIRNNNGVKTSEFIPINGSMVNHNFTFLNKKGDCFEKLYAVNNQQGFYWINNENGNFDEQTLPQLVGGGSIACAVDRQKKIVYYNTGTTLRYYDIEAGTFHVVSTGNPFNGSYPRMEFNNTNGLLYIAKNEDMYIIDPSDNSIKASIDLVGIQSPVGGGDVAISLDGTIFMCTFSGLYRIDVEGDILQATSATAVRISAENLPFQPTSMAIDRNDRLYLATNNSNSQLIEMDKFDGAWSVVKTYPHTINDLGSLPCTIEELPDQDTDGDGIIDVMDDYPEEAEAAFDVFTPSELGWGSLGFEDLWPHEGDYDFNDMVINYRIIEVSNANNMVVRLKCIYKVKAVVNSFKNGFGVELPISPSLIKSVTGSNLTEGIVTLDSKGLESGHTNTSVMIVFDNAFENVANWGSCVDNSSSPEIEMIVEFNSPINPDELGTVPFNPFIFIDATRSKEVHLTSGAPTSLADASLFGTKDDNTKIDSLRYYKTSRNLPWAINIIHEFRYPKEGNRVTSGYNKFGAWTESGGTNYKDWYKDNSGYRNTEYLCN